MHVLMILDGFKVGVLFCRELCKSADMRNRTLFSTCDSIPLVQSFSHSSMILYRLRDSCSVGRNASYDQCRRCSTMAIKDIPIKLS